MPIESGTLILANLTGRVKDTNEAIETTVEEEAKKYGVHDINRKYEPRLISVGEGWVLKAVDEAIANADVNSKLTIEVSPEKGFGQREAEKVRMIPLRKFGDKASELRVGSEVELDNRVGIVRFIGSGRAQIDFNHKYAGKVLIYDVEVLKKLETDKEKAISLVRRRLPIEEKNLGVLMKKTSVEIRLPSDYYLLEGLQIIKKAIANDILKYVKTVPKVVFTEVYESPQAKEETKEKSQKPEMEEPEAVEEKAAEKRVEKSEKT